MYLLPYAHIFTLLGNLRNNGGDSCIVSDTASVGTCRPIQECSIANELVGFGFDQTLDFCPSKEGTIFVCCPDDIEMTNQMSQTPDTKVRNPTTNRINSETTSVPDIPVGQNPEDPLELTQDNISKTPGRPSSKWPVNKSDAGTSLLNRESESIKENNANMRENIGVEHVTPLNLDPRPLGDDSSLEDQSESGSKYLNSDMKTSATEYPKYTQKCSDKTSGHPGVCKPFDECPSSLGHSDDITLCGFLYDIPTICCVETIIDEDIIIFPNDEEYNNYNTYGFKSRIGDQVETTEDATQTQDDHTIQQKLNTKTRSTSTRPS